MQLDEYISMCILRYEICAYVFHVLLDWKQSCCSNAIPPCVSPHGAARDGMPLTAAIEFLPITLFQMSIVCVDKSVLFDEIHSGGGTKFIAGGR